MSASSFQAITVEELMVFLSAPPEIRRYPLSYVLSGDYRWGTGGLGGQDFIGDYWTTTVSNSDNAYNLRVNGNGALVSRDTGSKTIGLPLRCIYYSTKYPSVSAFVCIFRSLQLGRW